MEERVALKDQILRRIRGEFLEMPGMRLTLAQAKRLWGLDEQTCAQALESLITDRFLNRSADGTYARLHRWSGPVLAAAYGQGRSHDNGGSNDRLRTFANVMTGTQAKPLTAMALALLW